MKKLVIATVLLLAAAPLLSISPAEAAKRKTSAPARANADTYYYQGTGTTALRDRARPYFGSPVRGREFFEAITSPGD